MPIITFLSDFGEEDHYVASVKASILSKNPVQVIVDISHKIDKHDITHSSFTLSSIFRQFPKGSIHIVAINSDDYKGNHIVIKLEDHFFIGPNNGLFGLISERAPEAVQEIEASDDTVFIAKHLYSEIALKLANGEDIGTIGNPLTTEIERKINRQLRATKQAINGHVIRVDSYGNLITNIDLKTFQILSKEKSFLISFGREKIDRLNKSYYEVDGGDIFVLFNDLKLLEIGINKGSATQLLGLSFESPINIIFAPQDRA
ncbi:MAG: SAM-dependent chlorinase/fluorinase [Bacteroidota bacterium]